ncbi:MAG: KH domain-containing protein [Verrucomicrobiota bacterium]
MDSPTALQEFLEYVVSQLIAHHDQASIAHEYDRGRHVFVIVVGEEDMGKVLGRNGQTISAIRSLVQAAAQRNDLKATVKLERRRTEEPTSSVEVADAVDED